ncbi:MAG TPA: DUF6152 family protein [Vicinamibacterales bacterium]|nr:DUF6152 family protein [Vicinamibacterales bacterium]
MRGALAGLLFVMALTGVASAHHTISAVYDVSQRTTLNGVITDVEWKQPHVIIHVDVRGANGSVVWDVETQGAFNLKQRGLSADFVKPGETVTVTVCVAKDGSHKGWLHEIVSPAGTTLFSAGGC